MLELDTEISTDRSGRQVKSSYGLEMETEDKTLSKYEDCKEIIKTYTLKPFVKRATTPPQKKNFNKDNI